MIVATDRNNRDHQIRQIDRAGEAYAWCSCKWNTIRLRPQCLVDDAIACHLAEIREGDEQ